MRLRASIVTRSVSEGQSQMCNPSLTGYDGAGAKVVLEAQASTTIRLRYAVRFDRVIRPKEHAGRLPDE